MRIVLDERYRDVAHQYLQGHEIAFYDSGRSASMDSDTAGGFDDPHRFLAQVENADILACGAGAAFPFDEGIITCLPRLQYIQKIGAGTDWFDIEALNRHGVLLANNAGLNSTSIADHLVMLILMCLRSVLDGVLPMREGKWPLVPPNRIIEVEATTIGIVGFGKIGSGVARRLLGFGDVRVLAHQRRPLDPAITPPGVRYATLNELLSECDVLVVCVPLTVETDRLIGARELALMKPGSVLVNGSRGRIVDERALYDALASGHLGAAASDVFEVEPTPPDNPLLQLGNFIGTPHMAGRSRRNSPRQLEMALRNISLFLAGGRPERLVNPELLDRGVARTQRSNPAFGTANAD
jgi:phosphogluconate 2-dehydrogenase